MTIEDRVAALEAVVSTVRVEIHPSRKVAAHSCWSGTLAEYAVLQPFTCHGCQQFVSRSFSAVLVAYTEERMPIRTTVPETPERSGT